MTGKEYVELAMRTNDGKHTERLKKACFYNSNVAQVLNGCLGLAGESGEFLDMVKKAIYHSADLDQDHLKKELGDVMWYVALICHAFEWDLDEIMRKNIDKLKARYPQGFDTDLSAHRKEGDL